MPEPARGVSVQPIAGESHEGRQWGYMILLDFEPMFYSDPVDEDGNVVATAFVEITHSSGWGKPLKAVKVPHSELGIDADTPTIRVREEDFPDA